MIPFIKRKPIKRSYTLADNWLSVLLLLALFVIGLVLAKHLGVIGVIGYLLLWVLSYVVIYAGACRYCVYYGKRCPVPLEGSLVNKLFKKSARKFNFNCLAWAGFGYLLRIAIPAWVIVVHGRFVEGVIYLAVFSGFWLAHGLISGCPHCANTACILNPDCKKGV